MRIINYKKPESSDFQRYVDIGLCESQIESYCIYNQDSSLYYIDWLIEFNKISLGEQMLTLNYYWIEFHQNSELKFVVRTDDYFMRVYGEKIDKIITENYNLFYEFNEKWFDNHLLFGGLDLLETHENIDYIEDNDDGFMTKVYFKDGSEIEFLDDNDNIFSLYVLESDYTQLLYDMSIIVNKFN
jgi:hypothetical protein